MPNQDDFLAALARGPRPQRLRSPAARDGVPAPAPLIEPSPPSEVVVEAIRLLRAPPAPAKSPSRWIAPVLFVLFIVAERGAGTGILRLALTLVVLFVHELGHIVAMRAFGYTDTRIFFVPFVGALATGKKDDAPVWQRCVVLLAGPAPGILLGALLAFTAHDPLARLFAFLLVLVNLVNLLPVAALDGGRTIETLVVARWPSLEGRIARVLAILLGVAAWQLGSAIMGVLAVLSFLGSSIQGLAARCAARVRVRWPEPPASLQTCPATYLDDIVADLRIELASSFDRMKAPALAEHARRVHERVRLKAPSGIEATLAVFAYGALVIVGAAAFVALVRGF